MEFLFKISFFWFSFLICFSGYSQDYSPEVFPWEKEDLDVTHFRNGDLIFFAQSDEDWDRASNEGIPAYCFVNGDRLKGVLYNWFAVNDARGIAPEGFRIPNSSDFEELLASGQELKSKNGNWIGETITEKSKFNAVAKGYRGFDGSSFLSDGYLNYYWTTDKGKSLYAKRFGVITGQNPLIDQGRREDGCSVRLIRDFSVSLMPKQIYAYKSSIKPNENCTLRLDDGFLGEGAQFYWFKGQCYNSIANSFATGRMVKFLLNETTDIYVAIFNGLKKIGCISIKITVKDESILPSAINGKNFICEYETIDLELNDGELCTSCDWYWYDSPDFSGAPIGTGSNIEVKSTYSRTYYVRSESKTTGKQTEAISKYVVVNQIPPDPKEIVFRSGQEICSGDLLMCDVQGPDLINAKWVWEYDGKQVEGKELIQYLFNNSIAQKEVSIRVYGKNVCGRSSHAISESVIVNSKSVAPNSIRVNSDGKNLVINGGSLGTGANWQWYKSKKNENLKHVGSGSEIKINPRKSTKYVVKSEGGECDNSAQATYNYQRNPKEVGSIYWSPEFSNSSGWLHFGADLGMGWSLLNERVLKWDSIKYFEKSGYDFNGNINTHLVSKEFFMLGINGGLGIGFYNVPKDNYLYHLQDSIYNDIGGIKSQGYYTYSGRLGAEMLIGFLKKGKAKFLINYHQSITYNELSFQYGSDQKDLFTYYLNQETIGFGLRIGSNGQNKTSKQVDVLLTLNDLNNRNRFNERYYFDLINTQLGLQCNFWLHSVMRINTGILFSNLAAEIGKSDAHTIGAYFSISYSWDRFR